MDAVVVSGGGSKGFGMLGILDEILNTLCYTPRFFVGCSVGSIICAFLSLGYTPLEIFLMRFEMAPAFFDTKTKLIERMIEALSKIFETPRDVTFEEWDERTGNCLIISAFNIVRNIEIYYSRETHPDKSVLDALEESISIPLFLESVQNCVDGCLCSPFPIKYCKERSLGKILGVYTLSNNDSANAFSRNPYSDIKNMILHYSNKLTQYECLFADDWDMMVEFKHTLTFETFYLDHEDMCEQFFSGKNQAKIFLHSKNEYDKL